jgi:hypothetical protein
MLQCRVTHSLQVNLKKIFPTTQMTWACIRWMFGVVVRGCVVEGEGLMDTGERWIVEDILWLVLCIPSIHSLIHQFDHLTDEATRNDATAADDYDMVTRNDFMMVAKLTISRHKWEASVSNIQNHNHFREKESNFFAIYSWKKNLFYVFDNQRFNSQLKLGFCESSTDHFLFWGWYLWGYFWHFVWLK